MNTNPVSSHASHAGARTTVDLSLAADSCRGHIVVHDSGPPDDDTAPAANRPERRLTVVSGPLGMKLGIGRATRVSTSPAWPNAALYGGTVGAGPAPGGGWTVHATVKGSHS